MKSVLKTLGFVAFAGVLLAFAGSLAFYQLVRVGEFRRFIVNEIEQQTEIKVQLGEAHLEIGRILGISFHNVALTELQAVRPAITAEQVTARVALLPLLERKLVFYEIRLHRPSARLVRDRQGRIPLLEKILAMRFLSRGDAPFNLDLRSIRLTQGQIEFTTELNAGTDSTVRLSDTEAEIGRIRGEPLRTFISDVMKRQRFESHGVGLQFQLDTAVEKDGVTGRFSGAGKMLIPEQTADFEKAWWDADLRLVDVPPAILQQFAGADLGIRSVTGHLAQRLRLTGSAAGRLRIGGDLEFKGLAIDAPKAFKQPLPVGDGHTEFAVEWTPERLSVTRFFFRSKETKFSIEGEVREPRGHDPHYRLNLSALSMPVRLVRHFLPLQAIGSAHVERWATAFNEGELQVMKGGINARLSQIRRMAQSGIDERVWFEAELRNATAAPAFEKALPLTDVQARLTLQSGVLAVRNAKAQYGQSRISDLNGSFKDLTAGSDIELRARGQVDLAELQEQLKHPSLPVQINTVTDKVRQLSGRAKFDFSLRRAAAPVQFEGLLALENARLQIGEFLLTDVTGDLSVSPKEIKSERVRALLSASPVQIQLQLKDYAADNGTFDLMIDSPGMRAGIVTHWLLGAGSLQDPGMVRGSVRYQGAVSGTEGRRLTGQLDLANVQLAAPPLLQPLRELNGRIRIDAAGIDFQNIRGLLVGFPATFSGRWRFRESPQLLFDFAAPSLDVSSLLAQIDPESTEFYGTLRALGKISLGEGRLKAFEFLDFKSDVVLDRRVWRFTNPTLRSAGGAVKAVATVIDKPDTLVVAVSPEVQGVPVGTFLKWFGMSNSDMSGKVNLTGKLESSGQNDAERKKNLNGSFKLKIEDGTIHRLTIVIQLLNLLDLSRWFTLQMPDLTKQGIRFRSITGDFKITKGVYVTENLVVDSDDLRMTGRGRIDVPNDEIDFVIAVRPFAGIDTVIGYIPLIGRGISAIKNSFLVGSFNVRGPIDDPTITPAPLSTLSEVFLGVLGIPKNIIGTGGSDKKEAPPNEPGAEVSKEKSAAASP
jgi:uncharacterized protein YhdP